MKLERWLSCLQSAVLAFLISFGGCACLLSGFDLQADPGLLALWCGFLAVFVSVCMRIKLALVPLGVLALLSGYLWHRGILSHSVEALLYRLTSLYNAGYGIGVIRWSNVPLDGTDITPALCALASVTVLLTARTVCRSRRAVLPVLSGLLPLLACIVVTDTVPAEGYLYLLFCGLGILMLSQTTRRRDTAQGNRLAALVAIPTALAVALLFWTNPQQTYSKQQQAENLLQFAQDTLTQQISQAGTVLINRENLAAMGALSNPHLPVMDVTADKGCVLYLREQVFDTYNGKQWTMGDQYSHLTHSGSSYMHLSGSVQISTRYTQPVLFVPYYSKDSLPGRNGYTENSQNLKKYTYQLMAVRDESLYAAFPSQYPADLPADTLAWAKERLVSIAQDYPYKATPSAIADYVRGSALYSKQTRRMPSDETDFVRWFLEESETGYCAHFASATAVLLQAAGIPARYVTGYMVSLESGTPTTVFMDDAHAWVEYYNPEMGWRVLECTPSDGLPSTGETPTTPPVSTVPQTTTPPFQNDTIPEMTLPQQTAPVDLPVAPTPQADLRWLESVLTAAACLLGAVLLILGQWQLRRRRILRKLTQGTTNQRAVASWRQTVLFARLLRQRPDAGLFALAQKAKFSQHTLTEEELSAFESYLRGAQQQLKTKPLPYRIFCRLVFAVY